MSEARWSLLGICLIRGELSPLGSADSCGFDTKQRGLSQHVHRLRRLARRLINRVADMCEESVARMQILVSEPQSRRL